MPVVRVVQVYYRTWWVCPPPAPIHPHPCPYTPLAQGLPVHTHPWPRACLSIHTPAPAYPWACLTLALPPPWVRLIQCYRYVMLSLCDVVVMCSTNALPHMVVSAFPDVPTPPGVAFHEGPFSTRVGVSRGSGSLPEIQGESA